MTTLRTLSTLLCPVSQQYKLVPVSGRCILSVVGKVTVGLALYWPYVTDITGSRPCTEYDVLYLYLFPILTFNVYTTLYYIT